MEVLMRFEPLAELDRISQSLFGRQPAMAADVYRLGDKWYVHFDLPGGDPATIDVTVEKNTLTVTAERTWKPAEGATVLVAERPQGRFTRRFYLSDGLDSANIEAGYDTGVLTLTIPVAETAKPRKVTVGSLDKALTA